MKKLGFDNYNLSNEIKNALKDMGYKLPTIVQKEVIPLGLSGQDIIVRSKTGSGKTAAFGVPICELVDWNKNKPQALVITPTRELALQVNEDFTNIGRYKRIKSTAILGGQSFARQQMELKQKTHIVVGTPGRLLDHIQKGTLSIDLVKYLVIDEADEMLNMGFINQVESIIDMLEYDRVTMLFSATMPSAVKKLSRKYMIEPLSVNVQEETDKPSPENEQENEIMDNALENGQERPRTSIESNIEHIKFLTKDIEKLSLLLDLTVLENPDTCIIFCNTQDQVDLVHDRLKDLKYSCDKIHGGLEQKDRMSAINRFKSGEFRYLVATNLVARGIDVEDVPLIINYDLTPDKDVYIHRTGRTARAGRSGKAISLITPYDERYLPFIEKHLGFDIIVGQPPTRDELLKARVGFEAKMKERPKVKKSKSIKMDKQILKIRMNLGKRKGIRASTIVGIISNIDGITDKDIGIITVMDTLSFVEILNGKGNIVLKGLRKTKVKGKGIKVTIE